MQTRYHSVHARVPAGDVRGAEEACRLILRSDPSAWEAWVELAELQQAQGRTQDAIESYHHAVQIRSRNAAIRTSLGVALAQQRRLREAEAELRQACELDPANAQAHHNLGVALAEQNRLAEAAAALVRNSSDQPKSTSCVRFCVCLRGS